LCNSKNKLWICRENSPNNKHFIWCEEKKFQQDIPSDVFCKKSATSLDVTKCDNTTGHNEVSPISWFEPNSAKWLVRRSQTNISPSRMHLQLPTNHKSYWLWPTLSHVPWWPSQLQNTNSASAHAIATFLMQKNVYICQCTLLRPSKDVSVLMKNISFLLVLYCAWRISSWNRSLTQLWHSLVLQIQATALITTIIPHTDQT